MKITSKGQVTILLEIRQKLGLLPNTEVEFMATRLGLCKYRRSVGTGAGPSWLPVCTPRLMSG
jgi:bifunctional DNA-binding transcriptional regulator/antitoxin component of YhaV-PrlF toxin-antitoxin module